MDFSQLTPSQLRQAAVVKERIVELESELESILGGTGTGNPGKVRWSQTAAGRAKLSKSARKRWSLLGGNGGTDHGSGLHWTQNPKGRAKMARLMKKRWKQRKKA